MDEMQYGADGFYGSSASLLLQAISMLSLVSEYLLQVTIFIENEELYSIFTFVSSELFKPTDDCIRLLNETQCRIGRNAHEGDVLANQLIMVPGECGADPA